MYLVRGMLRHPNLLKLSIFSGYLVCGVHFWRNVVGKGDVQRKRLYVATFGSQIINLKHAQCVLQSTDIDQLQRIFEIRGTPHDLVLGTLCSQKVSW